MSALGTGAVEGAAKFIEEELADLFPAFLFLEVRCLSPECDRATAVVRRAINHIAEQVAWLRLACREDDTLKSKRAPAEPSGDERALIEQVVRAELGEKARKRKGKP